MREIKKKTWPELFEKVETGDKNVDYRLADFEVDKGDVLILEEYNPGAKQYTGRSVKKIIKNVSKIHPLKYSNADDLDKYGAYLLELGEEND